MSNVYALWADLFGPGPLQVATVVGYAGGVATLEFPGGGTGQAIGDASVGQQVYVRDGAIVGTAPNLPLDSAEV